MSLINLPKPLNNLFQHDSSFYTSRDISQLFDRLMIAMVDLLGCDRCHLYIRDPKLLIGQILHCHFYNKLVKVSIQKFPICEILNPIQSRFI